MSRADYVFVRPNGKPYRPRVTELRARAWENLGHAHEAAEGVIVFGTLSPEEAHELAWISCNHWYGDADSYRLVQPTPGWWRDSFTSQGRSWVEDGDRGAPGVMFTWAEPELGDPMKMNWCGFCLIPVPKDQEPAHKPNCPTL